MKVRGNISAGANEGRTVAPRRGEDGSATVVFIALLAIMVILVAVNGKALFRLHREVKFVEHQQIKRLNASQTNAVVVIQADSK